MVAPAPRVVVIVRFPFSDLSSSKFRLAVVIASAGDSDWILCQVTSNHQADPEALQLSTSSFASGGLGGIGNARRGKLFTASCFIISGHAGVLTTKAHHAIVEAVMRLLGRRLLD